MAEDGASDDLVDETKEECAEERRGVLSEARGELVKILASRLHMGQKVLHVVSHTSTQKA